MQVRRDRVTLDAVAQEAGVSKATVSKVLNGRPDVAPSTRAHVQAVLETLGYRPTRRPRTEPRPTITVLFNEFATLYSSQVLTGVVGAAQERGVAVVVTNLVDGPSNALTSEWFREIASLGHLGLITVTTELDDGQVDACADAGLGLVVIDPVEVDLQTNESVLSVSATNWSGGLQATEHLLRLGHRRIGFVGGKPASRPAEQRLHGHLAALQRAGLESDPELIDMVGFDYEDGRDGAGRMLDLAEPPTAIVAGCDVSALGVMEASRLRGVRLPEELSIVGFDDTYAAGWASPQLTTVRQPIREMGRAALRELLSAVRGVKLETHHLELSTALVVRDSTAPPR
ncbi:LacI family DNA-binding transcriptional regulator [Georgenia halophila]|uniref:LacI family DNA-binding transcriptional regulator n=2 Tax=Georgenia halophila TaxID=620889 RepID=A0ABP8LEQ6_9MICO